jgi:Tfp pilus assembly protein PilZ
MSDEQRREKRIETRQRLWCEGQDAPPAGAETRDVSRNGMFIVADDAPEIGSQMKVTLQDDGAEVTLNMEVVWRGKKTEDNKTGVGVRIVGFDKGRDIYERFINRHLRPSNIPSQLPKPSIRPGVALQSNTPETTRPSQRPVTGAEAAIAARTTEPPRTSALPGTNPTKTRSSVPPKP